MAKKTFMPSDDKGKSVWLIQFATKLKTYAAKYGITDAEVADMEASGPYFSYWLGYIVQSVSFGQKLTAYKNELRDGAASASASGSMPVPPAMDAPPQVVPPGIFGRASALAARIKSNGAYSEADGLDMGLVGAEDNTDKSNVKPIFSIRLVAGGRPEIVWTKSGMTGVEIWADRIGNGTFTMIDVDNTPNFIDMAALPAQPALWNYKLIYRQGGNQIGHWSDVVSITVHA